MHMKNDPVANSPHAIYISHLRTKVVTPLQKENLKMVQDEAGVLVRKLSQLTPPPPPQLS
jgi:hypothetical protein